MQENAQNTTIEPEFSPEQARAIVKALTPAMEAVAQTIKRLFDQIVEGLNSAAGEASKRFLKLVEAELYFANDNPRWWHIYKHTKKARTRKKYRRRFFKQLKSQMEAAEKRKEANT